MIAILIAGSVTILSLAIPKDDSSIHYASGLDLIKNVGAIASNGAGCASVGRTIFESGGSVADAAIAVLLCEGLANPQSMGLGGGFVMTIYHKETGLAETLNARERAPAAATENMYVNNDLSSIIGKKMLI